ncbi:hypothetical protein [Nocardioides terrisoli]|uniref:hypothetical protein n=1 Tax=Nocardioides terrisoli TaxID=3388267 RepID=UPI00287B9BE1|nr:hypothetical protein [Nocardioides marmorisolisilvae]
MPKVRSSEEPFPDRKAQHEREIADLRLRMAALVKIVFTVIALFLALGALLVVAGDHISTDNALVRLVWHVDNFFDGPFSRDNGVFVFTGKNAAKLDAIVNWGLGAVVYMVIGNLLRKLMRPRSSAL